MEAETEIRESRTPRPFDRRSRSLQDLNILHRSPDTSPHGIKQSPGKLDLKRVALNLRLYPPRIKVDKKYRIGHGLEKMGELMMKTLNIVPSGNSSRTTSNSSRTTSDDDDVGDENDDFLV